MTAIGQIFEIKPAVLFILTTETGMETRMLSRMENTITFRVNKRGV